MKLGLMDIEGKLIAELTIDWFKHIYLHVKKLIEIFVNILLVDCDLSPRCLSSSGWVVRIAGGGSFVAGTSIFIRLIQQDLSPQTVRLLRSLFVDQRPLESTLLLLTHACCYRLIPLLNQFFIGVWAANRVTSLSHFDLYFSREIYSYETFKHLL